MKQSFETRITMRLYNTQFTKQLDDTYLACGERFESKNHFLTELLRRGLSVLKKEIHTISRQPLSEKNNDMPINNIRQLIEDLHVVNKQQAQELLAHLQIFEKLTSAIYNMLLALCEDERISTAQLESGFYDDLPERFSNDLRELLKHIFQRLPK